MKKTGDMRLTPVTSWRAQDTFASIEKEYIKTGSNFVIKFVIFTYIPLILISSKFFYSPTDAQVKYLKNNFKICNKTDIKTSPTYFVAVTPSSGNALLVRAKITVDKIAN